MLVFLILTFPLLGLFSQEIPINSYFLKDNFSKNFTISNHPIPFNCLSFKAAYSDNLDEFEDTYKSPIIENLKIIILFSDKSNFDIKILDDQNKRYEIPSRIPFPKDSTLNASCRSIDTALFNKPENTKSNFLIFLNKTEEKFEFDQADLLYKITLIKKPFAIQVVRKSTGESIYNTINSSFIFTDKYIEIQNKIRTDFIMGFGERNFKSKLDVGDIYTSWSRDEPNEIEDGWPPGKNTYSYHPMYLAKEASGNFNIGFLRISNAFDLLLMNDSFKIVTVFILF